MLDLQFERLWIANFKCFGEEQNLNFSSYPPGLYGLRGVNKYESRLSPNGAGKTSILDALCWTLFGKTPNNLKNPDILPWRGKGSPSVSLMLGKQHINRQTSPNKLTVDGEHAGQDKIDALVGINSSTFMHTILLGQGQKLFLDLSPRDKMALFSEVLQLDRWTNLSTLASANATDLTNNKVELQGKLSGIESSLTQMKAMIDAAKAKAETWEADRQKQISDNNSELIKLKELREQAQERLDNAALAQEGTATEAKALRKEMERLETSLREKETARAGIVAEMNALDRERINLEKEFTGLGTADKCPTCGQSIKGTSLDKHKSKVALRTRKLNDTLDKQNAQINAMTLGISDSTASFKQVKKSLKEFDDKADNASSRIKLYTEQAHNYSTKIEVMKNSTSNLECQSNTYQEQVRELKKRLSLLRASEEQLIDDITIIGRKIERTKFWIKGFKDIQLYVIEDALSELELVTNSMLPEVGLEDWRISYSIERETQSGTVQRAINVSIMSPSNKNSVKLESWSGGEGQRLRVIGALALSDVLLNRAGVRSNIEILDEPLQYVAREGMSQLCEFLSYRAKQQDKQIWLIDHLAVPSLHFSGMVTVIRESSGFSRIEA